MTQKHLTELRSTPKRGAPPKIESPLLGHNQINHEVEKFIAQGLQEEQVSVRLFPHNMKLQDRLVALYAMRQTVADHYTTRSYSPEMIARQPLMMGISQLIQEYVQLDHELSLLSE